MPPRPYMKTPVKCWVQATASCNLDCRVCYGDCGRKPRPDELTFEEHVALVDYFVENGVMHVLYEGGEPLNRPDFPDIVDYAGRRLLTWIRTNGTLVTPELAQRFERAGVAVAIVDVFGASPETHEAVTAVPGSFERSIAGVSALVDAGLEVIMATILNRENVADLQQYVDLAAELGVRRVGCLRLYPLGRAKRNWSELALGLDEMTAALDSVVVPDGLKFMQSWHPKNANCCWQNAAVDAYGASIGCPYLRGVVDYGNIRSQSLLETWDDPLYRRLRDVEQVEGGCSGCQGTSMTKGGCRVTAYAFRGSWDAHDPFCREMNDGVDLRRLPDSFTALEEPVYVAPR